MKRTASAIALVLALMVPTTAFAYVGPGAGLSLLGALWALIAAAGLALFFVVAWPLRRMLRKRRERTPQAGEAEPSTVESEALDQQAPLNSR